MGGNLGGLEAPPRSNCEQFEGEILRREKADSRFGVATGHPKETGSDGFLVPRPVYPALPTGKSLADPLGIVTIELRTTR